MQQHKQIPNYICYSPTAVQKQRQNGNSFSPSPRDNKQGSPSINSSILNYTASEPSTAKSVQISGVSLLSNCNNFNVNNQASPVRQLSPQILSKNPFNNQQRNDILLQMSPQSGVKTSNQIRILANESNSLQNQQIKPLARSSSIGIQSSQTQKMQQTNINNSNSINNHNASQQPFQLLQQQQQQQQQQQHQLPNQLSIKTGNFENFQTPPPPPIINNGINNIVYLDQETQKKIDEQNKKYNQIFVKEKVQQQQQQQQQQQHTPNNFSFSQKNQVLNSSQQISQQQIQSSLTSIDSSRNLKNFSPRQSTTTANTQQNQQKSVLLPRNAILQQNSSGKMQQIVSKNQVVRSSINQLMNIDENIQKQIHGNQIDEQQQKYFQQSDASISSVSQDQTRQILSERNLSNILNITNQKGSQKNTNYEQKIVELQNDRSQLLKMVATKQLEIDDLKSNSNQEALFLSRIDKLVQENELLNLQNQNLANDYQKLNEKVNSNLRQMQEYTQLNEENDNLCEQAEEYREILDKLELKINILSQENTTLLKMVEEKQMLIENFHSKEVEKKENESQIQKYQEIIDKKNSQIKQLDKQIREIQESNKQLKQEIILQQEQFTEEKLNEAISSIVSEKNILIDQLTSENNSFKIKIKTLCDENKQLQERITKLSAMELYSEQLKTTKEAIEEKQILKDKLLMENSDIIQEMKRVIDLDKEQLELKDKKIFQLKEDNKKEKDRLTKEYDIQMNSRLEEIKSQMAQIDNLSNELVQLKKSLIEEKNRAQFFEGQYKQIVDTQDFSRNQQEQIILEKCLEYQKCQQDNLHYLQEIEELKNRSIAFSEKVDQLINLNETLNEALKEKTDYNQELLIEKDRLIYEREQEQLQFARIQNNLHQLEEERENFLKETQDVYDLKEKVNLQEINRYKSQIEDLKAQISHKESDFSDQFQQNLVQLEQSQQEILQLKDQINKLNLQISQAQQEGRLKQQERIHFDSTILELQKLNENNQIELANLKEKVLKLESQKDKLQRQLNEEKEENDLKYRKSEQSYESQIAQIDTKYRRLLDEFKYLSENYEQKKQELNAFKEELPQIASKVKNEKIELIQQIEEKDKLIDSLSLQNKVYQERIIELESTVNIMMNKNDQVQNTLLAIQTQYSALENKYSQSFKKIQQLEKQNENTKSHLTISLSTAETQLSQIKMQNIELETKNKRLQDEFQRANHLKQLMKDQMEDLEINFKKEMDDVREESIKDLSNKYEREKRELNFKIQKLGNQVRQLESDKDTIKQDLDAKQREVEQITLQLQRVAEREKNLYQKQKLSQFQ